MRRDRLWVKQSTSGAGGGASTTLTLPLVPTKTLVAVHSTQRALSNDSYSHTGYDWSFQLQSSPGQAWRSGGLLIGRKSGPDAASKSMTFTSLDNQSSAVVAEFNGLRGEVLWSNHMWTAGTTLTVPAPLKGFKEDGLLLVLMGRSITATTSGVISTGQASLLTIDTTWLKVHFVRYLPGSRPSVDWTFSTSGNQSAFSALIR